MECLKKARLEGTRDQQVVSNVRGLRPNGIADADYGTDPNLYYHGGDVRMARFFSQFIALQIQADVLGYPMQPYLD